MFIIYLDDKRIKINSREVKIITWETFNKLSYI